ncbi:MULTISPECIES: FkbM family methyltransferase [unclassified Beijerinckia]|uniref:FkbM family methyltransferase n=1 Tax=unclassified Beijerinckia TaxID=2638183 RepID=UPI000895F2F4|nr:MULTISPECIES: FkbM family methyltransferase [unclassified Beijerinckia]MDH7796999.1 FkbM family methyltransferase [Beijerinckia sp. GAS462]SEC68052.1 methyltransferase, FkbM family [Beijerinckia sp. 28-YEA-48]
MSHSLSLDAYWRETADFIAGLNGAARSVIVPTDMQSVLPNSTDYENSAAAPAADMVVLHKGEIERLGANWIVEAIRGMAPVYANAVFVVFSRLPIERLSEANPHVSSFRTMLQLEKQRAGAASKARQSIYLGNNRAITTTIYGHKFFVDTRDISLTPHLLIDGNWEPWVTDAFRQVVEPGMNVIDIGANMGHFALIAASLVGSEGHVYAFEANRDLAEIVHSNFSVNGFSGHGTVEAKAVFSSTRTLQIGFQKRYMGSSSIHATSKSAARQLDSVEMRDVPAVSLDDYFPAGKRIDLIKIDAEGSEPSILAGAERLLSENKDIQIFMEFSPVLFRHAYKTPDAFAAMIRERGFSIYRILADSSLELCTASTVFPVEQHWDVLLRRW